MHGIAAVHFCERAAVCLCERAAVYLCERVAVYLCEHVALLPSLSPHAVSNWCSNPVVVHVHPSRMSYVSTRRCSIAHFAACMCRRLFPFH